MSKQILFFATRLDLEEILNAIEAKRPIQYIRTGLFEDPTLDLVHRFKDIADLGIALKGDHNLVPRYLVADRNCSIQIRKVIQRRGGIRYAVDQLVNPKTIAFTPGGRFENHCLIDGNISTVSIDPDSLTLFNLFSRHIKRHFNRIKSYWVGENAAELLDSGLVRLTSCIKSPETYDLSRE